MADLQIIGPRTVGVVFRNADGSVMPASSITGAVASAVPDGIVTVSLSGDNTQLTITPVGGGVTGRTVVQVDASAGTESLDVGTLGVHVIASEDDSNAGVEIVP